MGMVQHARLTDQSGFTLVELMVTTAIILILFGLSTINFGQAQSSASTASSVDSILTDIKSQQLLAMVGETGSATSQQPHGIFVQAAQYTLFAGSTYNSGDSNNFTVAAGNRVTLSTTFPSSQLIFNKGDGSVSGFTAGSNTITITAAGSTHTITVGRFGATTVN